MITNAALLSLTATMPMKQIDINGRPYLQRYYAGTFASDEDLWLHRFISCDGERHLHCHPFDARSIIMTGGYTEETPDGLIERLPESGAADRILSMIQLGVQMARPGPSLGRVITVYDWHRIAVVQPGTWTAFIVKPQRLPMWHFMSEYGKLEPVMASPRDWWKQYGVRA